ncbi:inter-alpha-trypsin inhibitor heavy chain H3-like [Heteronotia binoei]|uniref:inter-alpha-trypsin inhibitor heavy chain H3-like n=1 Tax=Heteronotia binoei TaxID=13085 RepID=UPI00292F061D|nr:inter-alpha-trypsin inhibitor heavy chain H3-like [Heteronotia binoei]
MGKHELFCVLLVVIPGLVTSDFLIEQFRNIQKRHAADVHTKGIEIYWMKIDCRVTSRFSRNVVTSRAVNRANVSKEAFFDMELPKTAFITNFTMSIDGVIYPGIIKEKEVAQQQYQKAVSSGQTAGLVKASGRKTEKFSVSVNIAAASKVTFELTYEELLKRNFGKYEMFIKVNPKQLVNKFEIDANIFEPQGISDLEVEGTFINNDLLPVLKKSFSGKRGHVSFSPTIDQQRICDNCTTSLLLGDFVIKYDVNRDSPNNLQIVNGYFVHFFAPKNLTRLPKNVVLVIDHSGSMYGEKIVQTRQALTKIVEDLKEEDYFNLIPFASRVSTWKDTLVRATPENVNEAKQFIQTITASGSTNLLGGLLIGAEVLNIAHQNGTVPERSASLIIMLTDGQPDHPTDIIYRDVQNKIQGKYPLYNLGIGYDLDYAFIDKLAKENSGLARRIYADSDTALQLQGFYDEVANPLLTEVTLEYSENAISDLTQNSFKHFYDGSEIVVAGRITDNDLNVITTEVKAHGAFYDLTFSEQADIEETAKALEDQEYIFGEYIERLWAYLTIQQLLDKRDTATGYEKSNLTAEALEMSLKYKFVTPLTSMIVTKPEDNADKEAIADKPLEGTYFSLALYRIDPIIQISKPIIHIYKWNMVTPAWHCVNSVVLKYPHTYWYSRYLSKHKSLFAVDGDPHFIIAVPQKEDSLCFNINEDPGIVLNLIRDPVTGITVNGELIGDERTSNDAAPHNTYFGRLGIVNVQLNLKLEVTPQKITLYNGSKQMTFTWLDEVILRNSGFTLKIIKKRSLEISLGAGARFIVILHQAWRKNGVRQDFLGFYTVDSHRLSEHTHGLLGQFFHPIDFDILEVHPGSDPQKPDATMIVKNNQLIVTRGWQKDYTEDVRHGMNVPCWFIHHNGEGLINGSYTDYIVSSLF